MQLKQEESLNEIQLKLSEMNQVQVNLKASNGFQPSHQEETYLFGSINLNANWLNSLKSQILKDEEQCSELMKVCEFSPSDKWSLLYRGTRDGFGAKVFHAKCDGHANTLTILEAKRSSFIFGGVCIGQVGQYKSSNIRSKCVHI
jgi:hypothetical protein